VIIAFGVLVILARLLNGDEAALRGAGKRRVLILLSVRLWLSVGLKAPITVRDLHSEVRRDWIQLICRKLAHSTAVKTGLGECPKKRGSPEN
jgi:hypothetical protein